MTTVGRVMNFSHAPSAIGVQLTPPGAESAWDLAARLGYGGDVARLYPLAKLGLLESFVHLGNGHARFYRVTHEERLVVLVAARRLAPKRSFALLAEDFPCSAFEPSPPPSSTEDPPKDVPHMNQLPYNLSAFDGEAVILGSLRRFSFSADGNLKLRGLSPTEAHALLAFLVGGDAKPEAAVDGAALGKAVDAAVKTLVSPPAAPPAQQAAPGKGGRGKKAPETPEASKVAPTGEALAEASPEGAGTPAASTEEKPKDPWGIAPPGQDPDKPAVASGDLPEGFDVARVTEMGKLRDILAYCYDDANIRSFSKLLAVVRTLKPLSAVLSRIEDLEDRLKRATEMMSLELTA